MAFNQDISITSSDDGIAEPACALSEISPMKQGRITVKSHLKMVAKVFPTVRKEEPEAEEVAEESKVKVAKKPVFPWLVKFNAFCRETAGSHCYERLDQLMDLFIRHVAQDVKSCYTRPNRASKLRLKINDNMKFFSMLYKDVRRPLDQNYFLDRMSDILSMYIDMELKASLRGKEHPKTISSRIISGLYILLENSSSHITSAILKTRFFIKRFQEICIPVITKVLEKIPSKLSQVEYIQLVLVFKKWKGLVKRKGDRLVIDQLAARQLRPPLEMLDEWADPDTPLAQGCSEQFTLELMKSDDKDKAEGGVDGVLEGLSKTTNRNKLLLESEFNQPLLTEEEVASAIQRQQTSRKRVSYFMNQVWRDLEDITVSTENPLNVLFEDDFATMLKRRQALEDRQKAEEAAMKADKEKKHSVHKKGVTSPVQTNVGCVHSSSTPHEKHIGYTTPAVNQLHLKNGQQKLDKNTMKNGRNGYPRVPKMEADSQSQDEVIVIEDDEDVVIKVEPEEQPETVWDVVQARVLRAVVRPENIEQLAPSENSREEEVLDEACVRELESNMLSTMTEHEEQTVTRGEGQVQDVTEAVAMEAVAIEAVAIEAVATESVATESVVTEAVATVVAVEEPAATPSVDADLPLPPEQSKSEDALQVEETNKAAKNVRDEPLLSGVQAEIPDLWNEIDQLFNGMFEPGDPYGASDAEGVNDPSRFFFNDTILSQYNPDIAQSDGRFPDFYNDQQDTVFTDGEIKSPPMLDMMQDDPEEYQLSTSQWYQQGKEVVVPNEKEPTAPVEQAAPTVTEKRKSKGKRKSRAKPKEPSLPPARQVEAPVEKIEKKKNDKEVRGKTRTQRRKRGRAVYEEVEDEVEEEESEPEPEPEPKKKKPAPSRKRKAKERSPSPPPPPPPPPPPTNKSSRKSRGGSQSSSAVTKKKAQSRRR